MKNILLTLLFTFLALLIITPIVALREHYKEKQKIEETEKLVKSEARKLLVAKKPPVEPQKDAWDHDLKYEYEATELALIATVTSLGPDGVPSDDDIIVEKTDVNKSKIIGKYVGSRWKRAKEGFVEGLKDKSPFKKEEN
jgi:hypothetical protein